MDHDCVRALLKRAELEDVGIDGGGDQQDKGEQEEESMGQDVDQSGHDSSEGEGEAEGESEVKGGGKSEGQGQPVKVDPDHYSGGDEAEGEGDSVGRLSGAAISDGDDGTSITWQPASVRSAEKNSTSEGESSRWDEESSTDTFSNDISDDDMSAFYKVRGTVGPWHIFSVGCRFLVGSMASFLCPQP